MERRAPGQPAVEAKMRPCAAERAAAIEEPASFDMVAKRPAGRRGGLGVALVAAALSLGACASPSPRTAPSTTASTAVSPTASTAALSGGLDSCLLGTWVDQGESDTFRVEGRLVTLTGLENEVVTISADGALTASFAHAAPLRGLLGTSVYVVTDLGTTTESVSSSAGVLSFSDVNDTAFSETASLAGSPTSPPQPPPPVPDRYACSATTLSLSGPFVHATFRRSSPGSATSTAAAIPDLFVETAAIPPPGALYAWPEYPTLVEMDDNDWIGSITWRASSTAASGTGRFFTDLSCNGPAASCPPTVVGAVLLSASEPTTCTVTFAVEGSGVVRSEQVLVFDRLEDTLTTPTGTSTHVFPSPCAGPSGPPGRCHTSVLTAQSFALEGGGAAGSLGGAVVLTNHGSATCTLSGYPSLQLVGAEGLLPTTVTDGDYEVVDAVPEKTVMLGPGAEARFYFMYSDVLGGGSPSVCPAASLLEIRLSGARATLVVGTDLAPYQTAIAPCEGHLWVSPVTASTPFPLATSSS